MRLIALAVVGIGLLSSRAEAAFTIFTDRNAWNAAIGGAPVTQDFSSNTPTVGNVITYSDFNITFTGTGHTAPGQGNSGGILNDRIAAPGTTEFNFNQPLLAFGADWDLAGPGGSGSGILMLADGTSIGFEIPNSTSNTFFGFTSTTPFLQVQLTQGTQGGVETYALDNVSYAPAATVAPAPAAVYMLGLGLVSLIGLRRRLA